MLLLLFLPSTFCLQLMKILGLQEFPPLFSIHGYCPPTLYFHHPFILPSIVFPPRARSSISRNAPKWYILLTTEGVIFYPIVFTWRLTNLRRNINENYRKPDLQRKWCPENGRPEPTAEAYRVFQSLWPLFKPRTCREHSWWKRQLLQVMKFRTSESTLHYS